MKVYFSASLSKTQNLMPVKQDLAQIITDLSHVITSQHVLDPETTAKSDWEHDYEPAELYRREIERLEEAEVLVTEVTVPSFGAAFLIDKMLELKKPLLTLHFGDWQHGPLMLRGRAKEINLHIYTEDTAREIIKQFFKNLTNV